MTNLDITIKYDFVNEFMTAEGTTPRGVQFLKRVLFGSEGTTLKHSAHKADGEEVLMHKTALALLIERANKKQVYVLVK